jgi:hypothetical protein
VIVGVDDAVCCWVVLTNGLRTGLRVPWEQAVLAVEKVRDAMNDLTLHFVLPLSCGSIRGQFFKETNTREMNEDEILNPGAGVLLTRSKRTRANVNRNAAEALADLGTDAFPNTQSRNTNLTKKEIVERVLANFSFQDAIHDFGTDFKEHYAKNQNIGLPYPPDDTIDPTEYKALDTIIPFLSTEGTKDYSKQFREFFLKDTDELITTFYCYKEDDVPYIVKSKKVAKLKPRREREPNGDKRELLTTSTDFYTWLNQNETSAIAFAIDALRIPFNTLLSEEKLEGGHQRIAYFIKSREEFNDPAPKLGEIKESDTSAVRITTVYDTKKEEIQYPSTLDYPEKNRATIPTPYLFYSIYTVSLTPVQENSLSLKFSKDGDIKKSIDIHKNQTANANAITNISEILKTLDARNDPENILYHTLLQQKRSGDWLQVLACLDTGRYPELPPNTRTMLVTNDIIAVSYSLLMGVDVVFTYLDANFDEWCVYFYKDYQQHLSDEQKEQRRLERESFIQQKEAERLAAQQEREIFALTALTNELILVDQLLKETNINPEEVTATIHSYNRFRDTELTMLLQSMYAMIKELKELHYIPLTQTIGTGIAYQDLEKFNTKLATLFLQFITYIVLTNYTNPLKPNEMNRYTLLNGALVHTDATRRAVQFNELDTVIGHFTDYKHAVLFLKGAFGKPEEERNAIYRTKLYSNTINTELKKQSEFIKPLRVFSIGKTPAQHSLTGIGLFDKFNTVLPIEIKNNFYSVLEKIHIEYSFYMSKVNKQNFYDFMYIVCTFFNHTCEEIQSLSKVTTKYLLSIIRYNDEPIVGIQQGGRRLKGVYTRKLKLHGKRPHRQSGGNRIAVLNTLDGLSDFPVASNLLRIRAQTYFDGMFDSTKRALSHHNSFTTFYLLFRELNFRLASLREYHLDLYQPMVQTDADDYYYASNILKKLLTFVEKNELTIQEAEFIALFGLQTIDSSFNELVTSGMRNYYGKTYTYRADTDKLNHYVRRIENEVDITQVCADIFALGRDNEVYMASIYRVVSQEDDAVEVNTELETSSEGVSTVAVPSTPTRKNSRKGKGSVDIFNKGNTRRKETAQKLHDKSRNTTRKLYRNRMSTSRMTGKRTRNRNFFNLNNAIHNENDVPLLPQFF